MLERDDNGLAENLIKRRVWKVGQVMGFENRITKDD